jgi:hypothetical protein
MRRSFWISLALILALISMAGIASATDDAETYVATDKAVLQYVPEAAAIDSCCIRKGDVNSNGMFNIQDIVYLLNFLYKAGPKPLCMGDADLNCDCSITIRDMTCGIWSLYHSGPSCILCTCDQWFSICFGR